MPTRTLGPEGGWIMRSYVGWGGEQNILHKGRRILKTLKGSPKVHINWPLVHIYGKSK